MRFRQLMVGTAALGLVACGARDLTTTERSVEQGRVQARFEQWTQQVNNRDLDSMATMYNPSPDLIVAWSDGFRTTGLEDHLTRTDDFYNAIQFMNMVPQNPVHQVLSASVATTSFRYSIDMVLNDTSRDPYSGQANLIWVKDPADQQWRIHNQMFSRNER